MMQKGPKPKSVEIQHIPIQNDDTINFQLDKTEKYIVASQPKSQLLFVVYLILEPKSSTPSNVLTHTKQNR